jgi:hypothetical protein
MRWVTLGGILDIQAIVKELKGERDRLNRAIAALEGTGPARHWQACSPRTRIAGLPGSVRAVVRALAPQRGDLP